MTFELYTLRLMPTSSLKFIVSPEEAGLRLDRFVSSHSAELSRTRVQELIEAGGVGVDGKPSEGFPKVSAACAVVSTPHPPPRLDAGGPGVTPRVCSRM